MDEFERYREKIERRHKGRRKDVRRSKYNRRELKHKSPSFWIPAIIWQLIIMIVLGVWIMLFSD